MGRSATRTATGTTRAAPRARRIAADPGPGATTVLSFGYGSNLCLDRLEARLGGPGTALAVGVGFLAGHVLRFHKRSQDRRGDPRPSGKGNAWETHVPTDGVWGVVFRIELRNLPALDEAEGLSHGYLRDSRPIQVGAQTIDALTYLATDIDDTLAP